MFLFHILTDFILMTISLNFIEVVLICFMIFMYKSEGLSFKSTLTLENLQNIPRTVDFIKISIISVYHTFQGLMIKTRVNYHLTFFFNYTVYSLTFALYRRILKLLFSDISIRLICIANTSLSLNILVYFVI